MPARRDATPDVLVALLEGGATPMSLLPTVAGVPRERVARALSELEVKHLVSQTPGPGARDSTWELTAAGEKAAQAAALARRAGGSPATHWTVFKSGA